MGTDGLPGSITLGASLLNTKGNLSVGASATGTFSSTTGHVVTVMNGVITNIMAPAASAAAALNPNYLKNITDQINNISTNINAINPCALIQELVNEVMPNLQIAISGIEANISLLLPMITLPTANLGAIIGWIAQFTAPTLRAYLNYAIQLEAMLSAIATLTAAIGTAAARLQNCQINVPPIVRVSVTAEKVDP